MNIKQRIVLLVGAVLFVALGLYPPWHNKYSSADVSFLAGSYDVPSPVATAESDIALRYAPIFRPPQQSSQLDTSRLAVEWLCVVALVGSLIVVLGKHPGNPRA